MEKEKIHYLEEEDINSFHDSRDKLIRSFLKNNPEYKPYNLIFKQKIVFFKSQEEMEKLLDEDARVSAEVDCIEHMEEYYK